MSHDKDKQVLLICGGGGSEHDISLISADYLYQNLQLISGVRTHFIEIGKDGIRRDRQGHQCELRRSGELVYKDQSLGVFQLDFVVPCLHGPPGETGEIQAVFEMMGLPYLGCRPFAHMTCFNKVTTKLWFDALDIPNTPYYFATQNDRQARDLAIQKHREWGGLFIKAASQGSSIGCYFIKSDQADQIPQKIEEAFALSEYLLFEKPIDGRELEVSVYEYEGELYASSPGEIIAPGGFYTYEEKYDQKSQTKIDVLAKNISEQTVAEIKAMALKAFRALHLRHLSRVDFFLTDDGNILLNEINTFPGMTPISMFPKMMEANGHRFGDFLEKIIFAPKQSKGANL